MTFFQFTYQRLAGLLRDHAPRRGRAAHQRTVVRQPPPQADRITHIDLQSTLDGIVYDVVETLGYMGAMVATYEQGDILPMRAVHLDKTFLTLEQLDYLEALLSRMTPEPISLRNPNVARTYVYKPDHEANLSVQAVRAGQPIVSESLYSLFGPIAPAATEPLIRMIQMARGIREVIAVPFFLETVVGGVPQREIVGNLYALKRRQRFTEQDTRVLAAFARQAAAAILSERRRVQIEIAQSLIYDIQTSLQDATTMLHHVVHGIVGELDYALAMIATWSPDGSLALRAHALNAAAPPAAQAAWNDVAAALSLIALASPQDADSGNIGMQAITSQEAQFSSHLADICTPHATQPVREQIVQVQQGLEAQRIVAIPLFRRNPNVPQAGKLLGCLYAATRSQRFGAGEVELLQALAQQAAAGMENAETYRHSEERRIAAQVFGKMAFNASASVHALRNHIGAIRLPLQLIGMAIANPATFTEEQRANLLGQLQKGSNIFRHLDDVASLVDNLHQPWQDTRNVLVDIDHCIDRALRRIQNEPDPGWLVCDYAPDLPQVRLVPEMLIEVLKVLINNAIDAIGECCEHGQVFIHTMPAEGGIEILVEDTGVGIPPEVLPKIFDLRYTTKKNGLGFGLFWARDYLEGLGGSIGVESIPGQRTTFRVFLPVAGETL